MMLRAVVQGLGHHLPERVVPNSHFEEYLDTSDEWIQARTGIRNRRIAAEGETTSDLALEAGKMALENAGVGPEDLDGVIVATTTPDRTFPSVATMVQSRLGMKHGFAYDLQAVCAGFIYSLANANGLIRSRQAQRLLVIGAETLTRITNWDDRSTAILFGDGAGAMVLEAQEGSGDKSDRGIMSVDIHSDGSLMDLLYVDGGVSYNGTAGKMIMQGNVLFRHAVEKLVATTEAALEKAGLEASDIDWVVPHQANLRIIQSTAKKLGMPMERVIVTVDEHGNTSAASIPLALSTAVSQGKVKRGDMVISESIGGGLAWGAVTLRL